MKAVPNEFVFITSVCALVSRILAAVIVATQQLPMYLIGIILSIMIDQSFIEVVYSALGIKIRA